MSTASISYSSLKDASNEAKAVAKKLDKYADSLYSNVYKKLNKYDGSWNSNVSTAYSKTNAKISELRSEQSRYETYATDLIDLRDECKEVDKAVKSKVSSLTASFKEAHGIRNSKVENAISYFFTGLGNETAFGRWLGGKKDDFDSGMNYFKDSIKEWYNYEGGKEFIKGMLTVVFEVAIAIAGAVAAVATFLAGALTFGAVLVLAAALIGAAIALQDAWSNGKNEIAGYEARQNDDPATGKRRSDINSYSDYLRSSYMFGDDGETYHYNEFYNGLATGLEITSVVCSVITVINSCGKFLKNGFKWATGNSSATFKEIFTKDGMSKLFKGIGSNLKNGISKLGNALKMKDLTFFKTALKDFGSDFWNNLKGEFFDFSGKTTLDVVKNSASSLKHGLSLTKGFVSDGFDVGNIVEKVVLPSVGLAHIPGGDSMITVDDFYSIVDDIGSKIIGSDAFKSDNVINADVLDKISSISTIDISIPEIYVPEINLSLNAA